MAIDNTSAALLLSIASLAACSDSQDSRHISSSAGGMAGGSQAVGGRSGDEGDRSSLAPIGSPCQSGSECMLGLCADGLCCDQPCKGLCVTCDVNGASGTCTPVAVGDDPRSDCLDGACNGEGACALNHGETCIGNSDCLSAHCVDGVCCATACSNPCETCFAPVNEGQCTLVPFGQDPDGDCPGGTCDGASGCKLDTGEPCGKASECFSGFCMNGICCDGACGGPCKSCVGSETGSSNGLCAFISQGNDPANECALGLTCNGTGACGGGYHIFSKQFGSTSYETPGRLAVDVTNDIFLTGAYRKAIDFGGRSLPNSGSGDVFHVKLDGNGDHLWSRGYGSTGADWGAATFPNVDGGALLVGGFEQNVSFGGAQVTSGGNSDMFLARYDNDGVHEFSVAHGGSLDTGPVAATQDNTGNVIVVGRLIGTMSFGGNQLSSAGNADIYVAKYTGAGAHIWSVRFGDVGGEHARAVAVDTQNNIYVTGDFHGSPNFGGGPLTNAGGLDVFVLRLAPNGSHLNSASFGDAADSWGNGIAVSPTGAVMATGNFQSTIDFGCGTITNQGAADLYVATLTSTLTCTNSTAFVGQIPHADTAFDSVGNIVMGGYFLGNVDFGCGTMVSNGHQEAYLVKCSPAGACLWSKRFGAGYSDEGRYLAIDSTDAILLFGSFELTVDFGGGPFTALGVSRDLFLAKFTP